MATSYDPLLQPGQIGSLHLKNRIALAPMGENFGGLDGHATEKTQAYYEARARGGAGLVILGTTAVSWPSGTSEPHQLGISSDDFIPTLAQVVRRVQAQGAKVAIQINHSGKVAANDRAHGREMWVPSVPPELPPSAAMRTITPKELSTFVGVGPHPDRTTTATVCWTRPTLRK